MKTYSLEEIMDETIGQKGTPERDEFDARVEADLQAYRIGQALKEARLEQQLTQEQLGTMVGVKRSQVSRMERGGNVSLSLLSRAFRALNVPATLNLGNSQVALW